jgi:hypothetical protein
MVASVVVQELEEDLASIDTSIGDLVRGGDAEAMARKTWDFGESWMTEKMIRKQEKEGMYSAGRARPPQ